ncbi:non-POU domain-containing octamer-binding protein-like [Clytia hemisphaerica]|uniref:RRM domain-containing protein n=1 Tax=Clytia hemisphaerica TaxID=252671 RepID=A0A7M5U121_9CNID
MRGGGRGQQRGRRSFEGNQRGRGRGGNRQSFSPRNNHSNSPQRYRFNNTPSKTNAEKTTTPTAIKPEETKAPTPNNQQNRQRSRSPVDRNTTSNTKQEVKTEQASPVVPESKPAATTPKPAANSKPANSPKPGNKNNTPNKPNNTPNKPNNTPNKPNNTANANNDNNERVRYTGRPGEKKFSNKCRLFVANLNTNMTEDEVKGLFTPFGELSEIFFNKEKGFGFVRLDYRINAEDAKRALDKKLVKGRNIQVRYATHASSIELHGLDEYTSNELINDAMSQFGKVEKANIICDERGKSRGYAIVEFEWKKSAQKVLDRFKNELFVLGRLPKPVFAKPLLYQDDEGGITEESLQRFPNYHAEREFQPRFVSADSFEYQMACKWRDLNLEEQEKKAQLDQELQNARYNVQMEMESLKEERDAMKMREELARRQEELRMLEEDIQKKRHMPQMGHGGPPMMGGPQGPGFGGRGPSQSGPRGPQNNYRARNPNNHDQMNQLNLNKARAALQNAGFGVGSPQSGSGILQHQGGVLGNPGPRGPPMRMRPPFGGPPPRHMGPRGGDMQHRPRR